jgi:hypothetical protein
VRVTELHDRAAEKDRQKQRQRERADQRLSSLQPLAFPSTDRAPQTHERKGHRTRIIPLVHRAHALLRAS